jgi:phage replication-related protein YjqB (UPF0714/DUF867 family)
MKRKYACAELVLYMILIAIVAAVGYALLTTPEPQSAIDVFSTRFDECMATEKFTRDECVIYAKGE